MGVNKTLEKETNAALAEMAAAIAENVDLTDSLNVKKNLNAELAKEAKVLEKK